MQTLNCLDAVSKTAVILLDYLKSLKSRVWMFRLNWVNTTTSLILLSCNVCHEMKSALRWPCDIQSGQGHWKSYEIGTVNGAYVHSGSERIWLKSLHEMSKVEICATQDGTDGQKTQLITYIPLLLFWIRKEISVMGFSATVHPAWSERSETNVARKGTATWRGRPPTAVVRTWRVV